MNKLYNDTAVQAIANAIRAKNGSSDTYTIAEMSTALNDLSYYAKPIISNVALATFEADGLPLNSLKVSVEAKQASGTPSPSNPLPISGWDEVKVTKCGKNLCPYIELGIINTQTGGDSSQVITDAVRSGYIKVNGDTTYTFSGATGNVRFFQIANDVVIDNTVYTVNNSKQIRTLANAQYLRFQANISVIPVTAEVQVESSGSTTTYEPYNGVTTTITLPQTVYGGEVDVVNGVLRITHLYEEFDETATVSFGRGGESNWYYIINGTAAGRNSLSLSNMYVGAQITNDNANIGIYKLGGGAVRVRTGGTQPSTVDEFVTALGTKHLQVLSDLATPITIPLTPTLIKSLNGQNNLSVDCGEVIELEYFKEV